MSTILAAALHYAALGLPVFPCSPKTKAPLVSGGFYKATTDTDQIKAWWAQWPDAMIGMPTGAKTGIDVLDIDCKNGKDGFAAVPDWQSRSPVIVRTPSDGAHLWFASDSSIRNTTNEIGLGVDTRGTGGYVIVPPSQNGVAAYRFEKGSEQELANLPPFPADLRTRLHAKDEQRTPGDKPQADPALIAAALAVIPNANIGWEEWNNVGMAVWRATGGNDEGFKAFDQWSQKSAKYDAVETRRRWDNYPNSPPTQIGAGTIFHMANEASPGWNAKQNQNRDLPPEVFRLAGLSLIEYEKEREPAAEKLGVRVTILDQLIASLNPPRQGDQVQGQRLVLPEIEPWAEPVDGYQLIADMTAAICKHIVLTDQQALAISLWIIHSHLLDCAEHSARLHIASPVPRCGKSALLRMIEQMVPRALSAENVSTSAMFRVIEMAKPTLLIDEVDSFLNSENRDDLRGLLNSGHTPTGTVIRVVGENFEPRAFKVWSAVVLAGIGQIPQTIEDRSITINMRRRLPQEKIDRLRKDARNQVRTLGRRAARWAADNHSSLVDADPALPEALNDRAMDNWRLPIAIADRISPDLGQKAREAAVALVSENVAEESNAILALADVAEVFASKKSALWISSADLVTELVNLEGRPWKEWNRGSGLTQNALARLLKPFSIHPRKNRLQGKKPVQGYDREPIEKAAERYVEGVEKAEPEPM